jgi:hypothetical protein
LTDYHFFRFAIRNDKYRLYKRIASFIFFLNALAFGYVAANVTSRFSMLLLIVVSVLLIAYGSYCFFARNTSDRSYIPLYIISALVWATEVQFYLASAILIVLMVMQILAQYKVYLEIDSSSLRIQTYTRRTIAWNEVGNLVMKDGLLSIDFANQKIMQVEPNLTEPVVVQRGGSMNHVKWDAVDEEYDQFEFALNEFYRLNVQRSTS